MKKVLFINGSPRKKGNTSFLINKLSQELHSDISLDKVFLYDQKINPCNDCRACKKGDLVCTVKDDMQEVYSKIDEADILVIGTPIYWFGPTAVAKNVLDRLRPYYGNKRLAGKNYALILPAGTGAGDCDLTSEMFKRSFTALGVSLINVVTSESFDEGDAEKDEKALIRVKALANQINGV